ncbi:MAG: Gfo/Idh/MocA family oxidoreductase [Chloroflexi bacterium]|nr:Gfo/Idh/MocA family oxidoreductase [Chloroflexota bacterium]
MYRVAVIGCGGIARAHAKGYGEVPDCAIVAAADVSAEALTGFCDQYGIAQRFRDYTVMLREVRPDIVSICTWPALHAPQAVAATEAGVRGILCEKPAALTLAEADAMVAAAGQHRSVLIVGHQRRFEPRYALARELIHAGKIGTMEEIRLSCAGDLWSDGTHGVDLMRFIAGDAKVSWVFGQVDLTLPAVRNTSTVGYQHWHESQTRYGHPVEGGSLAQIEFASEVHGLLETGRAARSAGYQRAQITGSTGRIDVSGDPRPSAPQFLRYWSQGDTDWQEMSLPPVNAFAAEVRALIESIEHGTPHPLSGASARATLEVLVAIVESGFRHQRVTLPVEVSYHPLTRYLATKMSASG